MNTYTAKQLTEILQSENVDINLRTVRYYTQIGLLPHLEVVGNKRVYTDTHLYYLRAIITLSKTGQSLADIQEKLKNLTTEEVQKIGEQISLYSPENIIGNETHKVSEDVFITLGPRISAELKTKVIDSVTQILKQGESK
ncbi:MAG TPA: MerR family transcriptional regulator [Bacillota bacterium]|nr:MerR family transcriptional regulator [Bacillota bacterium]